MRIQSVIFTSLLLLAPLCSAELYSYRNGQVLRCDDAITDLWVGGITTTRNSRIRVRDIPGVNNNRPTGSTARLPHLICYVDEMGGGHLHNTRLTDYDNRQDGTQADVLFTKDEINDFNGVSVKQSPFNAQCDGETDDTEAIQKALNTGKKVIIPEGICITRELSMLTDGQILEGVNQRKSKLQFPKDFEQDPYPSECDHNDENDIDDGGRCLCNDFYRHCGGPLLTLGNEDQRAGNIKIQNLTIWGQSKFNDYSAITTGIKFSNSTHNKIENVFIINFAYGVWVAGDGMAEAVDNIVTDDVAAVNESKSHANTIEHAFITRNSRAGIYISCGGISTNITGGTEISAATYGVFTGEFEEILDPTTNKPKKPYFMINKDFVGPAGHPVWVTESSIESIFPVCIGGTWDSSITNCPGGNTYPPGIGGVGVYSHHSQKGVTVINNNFEHLIIAYQLGIVNTPQAAVHSATFFSNTISNSKFAVKNVCTKVGFIANNTLYDTELEDPSSEVCEPDEMAMHSNVKFPP